MIAGIQRRLAKLENGGATNGLGDLAATIEAGRKRILAMTEAELRQDRKERLAEMQARHTVKPFRGLELRLLQGLERVCARDADLPPAAAVSPGAVP